ncbi:hypothetical protein, partial [Chengkuizengella axinellae]
MNNNIVSTDAEYNSSDISSYWIVETTADTSTPVVKVDGINGTWTNLATSEATFTIDTAPSDNTADILIEYSVNFAGGQGIEHVPKNVLESEVNGQKLIKSEDGIVTIKAYFEGKESGDTDLVPHEFHGRQNDTLIIPNDFNNEKSQVGYENIYSLDSNVSSTTTDTNNTISQQLFSFNILRAIQDKLGDGFFEGCLTIEDKVQRANQSDIYWTYRWYGFGENPNGNKAVM